MFNWISAQVVNLEYLIRSGLLFVRSEAVTSDIFEAFTCTFPLRALLVWNMGRVIGEDAPWVPGGARDSRASPVCSAAAPPKLSFPFKLALSTTLQREGGSPGQEAGTALATSSGGVC